MFILNVVFFYRMKLIKMKGKMTMNKVFKRIISGIASAVIGVTSIASSFTMSASANVGDAYYVTVGSKLTNTGVGDLSQGSDAVYPMTLTKTGESLRVFCAGYMKPISNHNYVEVAKTASFFTLKQQKAINAVCYYGYATHKNETYYIATQALVWDIITKIPANSNLTPRNADTLEFQGSASNTQYSYRYIAAAAYSNASACAAAYDSILEKAKAYLTARPTASITKNKTYTLKYNSVDGYKDKYAVRIPLSELRVYSEENVTSFAAGCSGKVNCTLSGSEYILWINPDAVDSFGTKTIDYNRVFATDPVYREFHNASGSSQQPFVYAEKRDPMSETVRLNVNKVDFGDFTVIKKTYDVNGKVDAVIDSEVKAAARFVVVDDSVSAQNNYVQAAKQSDGSYKYVSSDRYSNTASKDPATVMQLDSNGKLKVTNLPLGRTYRVIEFATGAHYKLDMSDISSRSVSVKIDESNKSQTKEMPNYEQYNGRIQIEKTNNLGNVVPNIEFGIYDEFGKLVKTVITDSNGKASAENLAKGTYKVKELTVRSPYVVNTSEQTVKLDGSEYSRTVRYESKIVKVQNTIQTATLKIVKTDGATNQPIKNNPATFNIKVAQDYVVDGKVVLAKGKDIGTFKTDNNGELTVENIYVDALYTVTETVPPKNYVKAAPMNVTAAWDKTVAHVTKSQSFRNDWQEGNISVFKFVKKNNTNKPLANAKFALVANEDIDVKFEGRNFKYKKGDVIQKDVKTDANGMASFDRVPVGFKYIVVETEAPKGYVNAHPEKELTLKANENVQFVETEPVEVENMEIKLYVSKRVLAQSDDKNHINGAELKGAKMAIVNAKGETVFSWVSDGKEHLIEGIAAGTYTLKELAAVDGYQIATDIEFSIDDQNKVSVTGATVESKNDIPLIVMFDEVQRTEISKKDATTGKELKGAKLTLYDWNNKAVEKWVSTDKPHVIYGLVVGKKYTLHEDLQPLGYRKASDITFTIKGVDENGKPIVTKVEMKDEVQVGGLEVYKQTKEQKNIADIEFGLKGVSTLGIEVDMTARTDENGVAKFENVPVGKFTLTENGATVDTEVYIVSDAKEVEIKDNEITKVTIENLEKEGSIKVNKHTEGDVNIEGIEFTLSGTSKSGRAVEMTGKTDKDGICKFVNVPVGVYTIKESGGVNEAYLIAEPQEVTVVYAQESKAEFFNKEKEGTIKITKRTEGDLNVEGIKFILEGKSDSGRDIKAEGITDKDGVCSFTVPCGQYTITEDKASVPAAYLVAEKQCVKVEYEKQSEIEFFNKEKEGEIELHKRTENEDKNAVKGIRFVLEGVSDSGRKIKVEAVTDDNGVCRFVVPIGKYTITEDASTVPSGYLTASPQSVKVEYAKTSAVTFVNKPTTPPNTPPDNPPQTGYSGNSLASGIMLGIISLGAIAMLIAKKKDDKNEKAD